MWPCRTVKVEEEASEDNADVKVEARGRQAMGGTISTSDREKKRHTTASCVAPLGVRNIGTLSSCLYPTLTTTTTESERERKKQRARQPSFCDENDQMNPRAAAPTRRQDRSHRLVGASPGAARSGSPQGRPPSGAAAADLAGPSAYPPGAVVARGQGGRGGATRKRIGDRGGVEVPHRSSCCHHGNAGEVASITWRPSCHHDSVRRGRH